jgi:hypothetical protein
LTATYRSQGAFEGVERVTAIALLLSLHVHNSQRHVTRLLTARRNTTFAPCAAVSSKLSIFANTSASAREHHTISDLIAGFGRLPLQMK